MQKSIQIDRRSVKQFLDVSIIAIDLKCITSRGVGLSNDRGYNVTIDITLVTPFWRLGNTRIIICCHGNTFAAQKMTQGSV